MVLLAEWNFGILLTWTSEEGLPLLKEEVVEYFPCCFVVGLHCSKKYLGINIWVKEKTLIALVTLQSGS